MESNKVIFCVAHIVLKGNGSFGPDLLKFLHEPSPTRSEKIRSLDPKSGIERTLTENNLSVSKMVSLGWSEKQSFLWTYGGMHIYNYIYTF